MTSTTTSSTHTHTGRNDIGVVAGLPVTLVSDDGRVCKYAPTWAPSDIRTAPNFIFHDMFKPVGQVATGRGNWIGA
jgi:hypothetical protein